MKTDYKTAIDKFGFVIVSIKGTSMLPLLVESRDTVKLIAPNNLKVNDVVLYERITGELVLHRIIKIKDNKYVMCGDNQFVLEKNISKEQIIAVMEGYYKKENYIPCTDLKYQKYVKRRVASRSFRHLLFIIERPFAYIYHKIKRK